MPAPIPHPNRKIQGTKNKKSFQNVYKKNHTTADKAACGRLKFKNPLVGVACVFVGA
jgi:hypothetical protein